MTCFAVCLCYPHGYAGEVTVGTRRLCSKYARPIFSVRICVASELSAFADPSRIRSLGLEDIFKNRKSIKSNGINTYEDSPPLTLRPTSFNGQKFSF